MKKLVVLIPVLVLLLTSVRADSTLVLGWVDEFHAGNMECRKSLSSTLACGSSSSFNTHFWELVDSFYAGAGGTRINNRYLPYFDMAAERGTGDIAYREEVYGYGSEGDRVPGTSGCYKIKWF